MRRHSAVLLGLLMLVAAACSGGGAVTTTLEAATITASPTSSTTTSTSTTSTTVPEMSPSEELDAAIAAVADSSCAVDKKVAVMLEAVEGDLQVDRLGIVYETELGESTVNLIGTGILFASWTPLVPTAFTEVEGTTGHIHALLFVNHQRTLMGFRAFLGQPFGVVVYNHGVGLDTSDDASVFASWDGQTIVFSDEPEPVSMSVFMLLPEPERSVVIGEEALQEGWQRADAWAEEVDAITGTGQFEPTTQLEPIAADLDAAVGLFCVLLGNEWLIADAAIQGHEEDPGWLFDNRQVFYGEFAAQELLLAAEYLGVIADHYNQEDVDWLRAEDVYVVQDATDGVTSTSEFVALWQFGIDDALTRYYDWLEMAEDEDAVD